MVNRGPCACWLASWLMYSFAARQDGLLSLFEVVGALRPVPGLGLLQVQPIADRLRDVLRLHPAIGQLGDPGSAVLEQVAAVMANELGWDEARGPREIQTVQANFRTRTEA